MWEDVYHKKSLWNSSSCPQLRGVTLLELRKSQPSSSTITFPSLPSTTIPPHIPNIKIKINFFRCWNRRQKWKWICDVTTKEFQHKILRAKKHVTRLWIPRTPSHERQIVKLFPVNSNFTRRRIQLAFTGNSFFTPFSLFFLILFVSVRSPFTWSLNDFLYLGWAPQPASLLADEGHERRLLV